MAWAIRVQYDEVRGKHYWSPDALENEFSYRHYRLYYILAIQGTDAYMHFITFTDNCEGAYHLSDRISAFPNFTPEGKPGVWFKIKDTQPQRLRKRDWRLLLWQTCWREKMQKMRIRYEGGKANGTAGAASDNCKTIYYGPKGKEEIYVRTDRTDDQGRTIFALKR
jgi:hypothetical protein